MSRFVRKDIDQAVAVSAEPGSRLRSELSTLELVAIGLAIMIGAGIFTRAPTAYRDDAGPYLVLSVLIAAAVCLLVALCYAECSTRIPVAGSAYTFAYVTFGRLIAWLVSSLLVLEYTVGPALVARAWSLSLQGFLGGLGLDITFLRAPVDVVAGVLVLLLTFVLLGGVKAASRFTVVATAVKLLVLLVVVVAGFFVFRGSNYDVRTLPPMRGSTEARTLNPWSGTWIAAGSLFYAFIGFDSVSTMAEEARYQRRRLPRAILWSLGIATVLYVAVALMIVGLRPADQILDPEPTLATLLSAAGLGALAPVVTLGVLVGLPAGIGALLLGQSRIALAMSRDRLVPRGLAQLGPRRTPARILIAAGVVCALLAAFSPDESLQAVVNIGTLLIFVVVCLATLMLHRESEPRIGGSFRVRLGGVIPVLGAAASLTLIGVAISDRPLLVVAVGLYVVLAWLVYELLERLGLIGDSDGLRRNPDRTRFWRWEGDDFVATAELIRRQRIPSSEPRSTEPIAGLLHRALLDRTDVIVLSPGLAAAVTRGDGLRDPLARLAPGRRLATISDGDVTDPSVLALPTDSRLHERAKALQGRLGLESEELTKAVACCMVRRLPLAVLPSEDIGSGKPRRLVLITSETVSQQATEGTENPR